MDIIYDSWLASGKQFVGRVPDEHFQPISSLCNLKQGLQYTYFLKIEDQSLWWVDFVDQLNLTRFAEKGWEDWHGKKHDKSGSRDPCFYAPVGVNCHDYYTLRKRKLDDHAKALNPRFTSWHSTSASTKLDAHYTRIAARKVTDMYAEDLRLFGYPVRVPKSKL